jgi:predicted nucleic acid-binding protein
MIVVDASLGVKWFLDEVGSQEALEILVEHRRQIIAPDLFCIEVAAALVREVNALRDPEARFGWELARLFALFDSAAVELRRAGSDLISTATEMALEIGHPLKDCVYLSLAAETGCELVTCDARFAQKAAPLGHRIRLIAD